MDTPTQQPSQPTPQPIVAARSNWSWGGFMFDPVIILGTRNYMMLFFYLLAFVPFVNLIFWLVWKIYMGLNAHRIVNESSAFANQDERNGFMRGLDHAGWIMFIVSLVAIGIAFAVAMSVGLALMRSSNINYMPHRPGVYNQYYVR